jgi:hypothetical protein
MIGCYFCRTTVADFEAAVQADWIPSFYDGEREIPEPVCPACTSARLQIGEDGEFELAEHLGIADEAESAERGNAWPQAAALWQMAADRCADAERRAFYAKRSAWARDMQSLPQDQER